MIGLPDDTTLLTNFQMQFGNLIKSLFILIMNETFNENFYGRAPYMKKSKNVISITRHSLLTIFFGSPQNVEVLKYLVV